MSIDFFTILLTRLVIEVTRVADMDVAISAMSRRIWLDEKLMTEVGADVVRVVFGLGETLQPRRNP